MEMEMDNKIVVLFSGGWESTYCLIKAIERHGKENVTPIYFKYGALHQAEEIVQAVKVCNELNVEMHTIDLITSLDSTNGIFKGRNTIFMSNIVERYPLVTTIYFGCRNLFMFMDKFKDSNWNYGRMMGKALGIKVRMPCIMLPKDIEIKYVEDTISNAKSLIYSTE